MVDLTSLDAAVAALENSIHLYDASALPDDAQEKILWRDGVIQRFEFTFELCWKTLKRFMDEYGMRRKAPLTAKDFFRSAAEEGLIDDAAIWFTYLDMRNLTSHVYKEEQAIEVFQAARNFLLDARQLAKKLKEQIE